MASFATSVRAPVPRVASNRPDPARLCSRFIARSMVESHGAVAAWPSHIIVKHAYSIDKLKKKGVPTWPTTSVEAKTFSRTYERNEDCYILQGKALVTPEGGEPTQLVPGDFATFPVGMAATWEVSEPLRKHYRMH
uniref:(S)-ureidoglycine aminohydrolase cupin domain-containing protein n=1 Tax=Tetradesmus obliquus TaxID=3088 RepID=A0A383VBW6_TETOB|eukprot:jgi/Sobl393_1/17588/SZX62114.1